MRALINRDVAGDFLEVGKQILSNQFLFEEAELDEFTKKFMSSLAEEHTDLLFNASHSFKVLMWTDYESRHIFTCNFSGIHLLKTLEKDYHFSHMELSLFEELLSKYISEVVELIEPPKKFEGTNNRKPFTAL